MARQTPLVALLPLRFPDLTEVSFQLGQVWPERGKNQHGRLLSSKLEQKLNTEEVVKNGLLYMHGWRNWDFSVRKSLFNEHIVMTI